MVLPTVRRYVWTREVFERVAAAGGFDGDERIELLDGELWQVSPPESPHSTGVLLVTEALRAVLVSGVDVRGEQPFALDDRSQPQPDVSVVRGGIRDYYEAHPKEVLLLVEVSDTTLRHDRVRKLAAYARNGVPEYWILDLNAARLEVYRDPSGSEYESKRVLAKGDTVSPLCYLGAEIAVADLLP